IRQKDEKVGIIFLTTLSQYGLEGYKYQATNYIMKPIQYVRLKAEMNQWLKRRRKEDNPSIIIANSTGQYKVFLNSLSYVEIFGRKLLFHTEQGNVLCHKSMKEMENELRDRGFARCHASCLVNLRYVKNANGKDLQVQLITGETIPISQPKRKEFMEKLADYWGDML
ncbi:MAG: response regulator transcription factor, partial [Clostridiales bacterium]|nr:response regulator transcription factor [Clostridiales bacterium]